MLLIFEGFQSQNVLILILFSVKKSHPLKVKIIPDVTNSL